MSKTITESVGRGGKNRSADVLTVQQLLNQVSSTDGGPMPKLVEGSPCQDRMIRAIHAFQRRHFGWRGADALVEPGRQTIQKLNELTQKPDAPPSIPPSPPSPPEPKVLSTRFQLVQVGEQNDFMDENHDFFFKIIDKVNPNFPMVYWLGPEGGYRHSRHKAVITRENYRARNIFTYPRPGIEITGFECDAYYTTRFRIRGRKERSVVNQLWLRLPQKTVRINTQRPLPFIKEMNQYPPGTGPIAGRRGRFQLVDPAFEFVRDDAVGF